MGELEAIGTTYRLVTEGWLPVWGGILVAGALGWIVWRHLRREFAHRRPSRLVRWVLPTLRLTIVGLAVWLICRPVFQIVTRWRARPRLLVLVDSSRSMNAAEAFGALHRKIDVLEMLGQGPLKARNRHATHLSRALKHLLRLLEDTSGELNEQLGDLDTGVPLAPGTSRRIRQFGESLADQIEGLSRIEPAPTLKGTDRELREKLAEIGSRRQALRAMAEALVNECEVTAQEASRHPEIVKRFTRRIEQATASAKALRAEAADVQGLLDKALLSEDQLDAFRTRRLTRQALAEQAARRVAQRCRRHFVTQQAACDGLHASLEFAFDQQIATPLRAVLLVSDGSSRWGDVERTTARRLAGMKIPVHTVLVGVDGAEPEDAGLVGVDMWPVAVRHDETMARVRLKNHLGPKRKARVTVRIGGNGGNGARNLLCEAPFGPYGQKVPGTISTGPRGYRTVELPLVFNRTGRHQLVFETVVDGGDAYVGNERAVRVVDVLPDKARVLLVCDRLSDDFAAYRQVLASLSFVELTALVAAPQISELKTGAEAGAFPAKAEHWDGIALAVLLGRMPAALRKGNGARNLLPAGPEGCFAQKVPGTISPALEGLRRAVDNGLHVCIQDLDGPDTHGTWAALLGLNTAPVDPPQTIRVRPGLWPDLYQLGIDEAESLARWQALPPSPSTRVVSGKGISVLACAQGSVVSLIPRGKGLVVYNGITRLASLRGPRTSRSVNRVLAGIVTLALRPLHGAPGKGQPFALFPPQPVLGKRVFLLGKDVRPADASGLRGVADADPALSTYVVTDPQRIALAAGGQRIERLVHRPLADADFHLTPRAKPLSEIADLTGGRHVEIDEFADAVPLRPIPAGRERVDVYSHSLWTGWWPLPLLVLLVSAEYLLRRRAGRVM